MADVPDRKLSAETLRGMASEYVGLALTPAEVDVLLRLLEGLQAEIGQIAPEDRAGAEPDVVIAPEAWPT